MNVRELLFENQDLKYRDFNSKLIPNVAKEKIIGVRVPVLRQIAKEAAEEKALLRPPGDCRVVVPRCLDDRRFSSAFHRRNDSGSKFSRRIRSPRRLQDFRRPRGEKARHGGVR